MSPPAARPKCFVELEAQRTVTHSAKRDYVMLSSLGHFLRIQSAALGVTKVQASCESIQRNGTLMDVAGNDLTPDEALAKISAVLEKAKEEYKEAEAWLRKWFSEARARGQIAEDD